MGSFLKKASFGLALPFVFASLLAAQATTTTTLTINPSSYVPFNTVVTLTATVRDSWPVAQGVVDFCNADMADCVIGDGQYGSAEITGAGTASISQIFGYGNHNIKAVFHNVTGVDIGSSSSTSTLTVQASQIYASSISLGETGTPSNYTLSGSLTAFGSQVLSGTLTFLDTSNGNAPVGTASLNSPTTTIFASPVPYHTPMAISPARNVVVVDFNGDGIPDLAVTDLWSGRLSLFAGNGDGTFKAPIASNSVPAGPLMVTGDFWRSGAPQILVTGGGMYTFAMSCNCYAYAYTNAGVTAVATGDFNNDGRLDAAIGVASSPVLGYLETAPNGAFYPEIDSASGGSGEVDSIAVGDFNRDGNLDVAVISGGQISIMLGKGNGTFSAPVLFPVVGTTIATADFNGDGKLDLVVGSSSSSTGWLLFGNGDGTFGSALPFNAGSSIDSQIVVADINNDGHPDVVFTNSASGTVTVLFGNGEGSFSSPAVFPAGVSPASVAVGDFNGDGIPDLVVTNTTSNQVSVLLGLQVSSYSTSGISISGAGTHDILTSYSGDGSRLPSQSSAVPLTGIMATPTVNAFCSPNPITYGSTSTCTTAVSGGATGTVAWTINGAAWTTTSISGGAATVSGFSGSPVGSYTIGAAYSGDSGNNVGSSSTVLTIQPVTRTVGVSCSPNPTTFGNSSTTCTATASAGTGSLVFTYNGGTSWITVPISGGTASAVGFGGFGAGTYSVIATAHGDSNYADGASGTTNYVINPATPSVSVSCLANPITYGSETSSCTTSVTAGATGTIAWTINGGAWTTTPVTSPTVGGFAGYAAGPYTIGVTYSGDSNYTSGSRSTVLTIQKAVRTVLVSCSPDPTTWPATHTTCTATVSAGGGSVNFTYNGGTPWGTVGIGGGTASIAGFDGVAAGTYPVLATASGDPNYVDGASSSTNYVVNKATPTVGVSCAPNPITYGPQTTTCTIAVGGGATGAVAVTYNGTAWASPVLSSGSASVSGMNSQPAGSYSIVANYPGDANNNAAANSTTLTILQVATSMTGVIAPNPITFGESFTVSGHVNCNSACGNLQYFIDGSPWGINSLDGAGNYAAGYGTATTGVHMIQVNYLGDANHSPSSWGPAPVTVLPIATTVTVSCSPNPITFGPQTTLCTAAGLPAGATGTIAWTINGGAWTTTPVAAPTAGGFSGYPVGSYAIAVAYSGDNNDIGSSSSTVLAILPAMTTTTITSSLNPSVLGQNVSWPCSVTSPDGTPTGMITYTLDGNPLGTIPTTDAPWSGTGLTVGAHVLTCSFAAQGNFAASSGTVTQTVGIAPTVTELSSSANPIVFGGNATFTALVDTGGSVTPTASVAFTSNGVAIGSAAVSTVTTTNLLNNSDVSTWTASGPTLTANASAAPDGTLTATHVVFPANSGCCINIGMTSSSAWAPGSAYTYSVWLRSDSSAAVQVSLRTGPGGESDTMPTMTATWTRYTISGTVPVGATGNVTALMYLADTPGVDYYAWGAQVEQAATAGPYIATSGAPATGSGGIATLTTTTLPAGNDAIVATYGGDAGTGASTSNPLIEVVTEAFSTITWNNPAPIVYGTPLSGTQLNATASVPGTFTYSPVAGTMLSAGSLTLSVTFTPTDSANYSTQTATVTLAVNKATLSITPNPASKVYGTANPAFTGTITGLIPGDAISVGYTSAATTTTVVGVYSSGPNAISSTTSGPVNILGNYNYIQPLGTLTITQATTTLIWATPAPITYGTPLSGTQLNATSVGVVGTFVYTPAAGVVLAAGSHTLTVTFTPTDTVDYSPATATVALTVNQAAPTVTLTSSLNPANYGTPVTFTAQTAASTTGSMTFYDGATIIGTGTISGGIATYTTATLSSGSHSVTASYGGDSNYSPAGSAVLTEVITRTAATITLASTVNPSAYGETTTFTFTASGVAGLGTPSGTVVISDGATWLATPSLDASGVARFTTAALLVGSHTLTAVYGGDVNYK